jgi:hypothetical protein
MVRELFVQNGNYVNLWSKSERASQPSLLGIVDAKGFMDNSHTKHDAVVAKKKAIALAKDFEKKGWKKVSIRAGYSYGYTYPYRYDIEAWGGFSK